jgi:hypothetical protein
MGNEKPKLTFELAEAAAREVLRDGRQQGQHPRCDTNHLAGVVPRGSLLVPRSGDGVGVRQSVVCGHLSRVSCSCCLVVGRDGVREEAAVLCPLLRGRQWPLSGGPRRAAAATGNGPRLSRKEAAHLRASDTPKRTFPGEPSSFITRHAVLVMGLLCVGQGDGRPSNAKVADLLHIHFGFMAGKPTP